MKDSSIGVNNLTTIISYHKIKHDFRINYKKNYNYLYILFN